MAVQIKNKICSSLLSSHLSSEKKWFDLIRCFFGGYFFPKLNIGIVSIDYVNTVSYKSLNTKLFVNVNFSKKFVKTQRQVFYLTQVVAIFVIKKFRTCFLTRPQKFDKISQLIWNLSDKRQISREMSSNFCGLPRKPELCNVTNILLFVDSTQKQCQVLKKGHKNIQEISRLNWNLPSKRQSNGMIPSNFCGILIKPEMYDLLTYV